jgi:hypothetical protein
VSRSARVATIARAREWLRRALALAAVLVGAGVLRADAPSGQYAAFDRSATCISDNRTLLTWMRAPIPPVDFTSATNTCAGLDANGGNPVWRVPSVNELETLVDDFPTLQSDASGNIAVRAIDANAFPGTPIGHYWTSSSSNAVLPNTVWTVEFGGGSTAAASMTGDFAALRCVTETPKPTSPLPASCNR